MNILDYIEEAKKRSGARSERALAQLLDMRPNMVTTYKRGCLPTDETMLKIAALAGISPYKALLDLNIWRSSGIVKKAYTEIKNQAHILSVPALFLCQMNHVIVYITETKRKPN